MKKIALLVFMVVPITLAAQQWLGGSASTNNLYREGNIAVGTTSVPPSFLSLFISNSGHPDVTLHESAALADEKIWQILGNGGRFRIITENDAYNAIQDAFIIDRNGINVTRVAFPVGNVGIGTQLLNNPNNYKLAVNGKIGAKEVQVENTSSTWPDYVFNPTYELPTLSELEQFIKSNEHLPGIPSKKEVEENGHKLGEMDVLFLKKIEEMTLYILDQEKRIKELERIIKNDPK